MIKPNIALIGKMGSGKTLIANTLTEQHGYTRISLADGVRDVAALAYGTIYYNEEYDVDRGDRIETVTGRQVLQRLGSDAIRDQMDKNFWVLTLFRKLRMNPNGGPWVVDDCRFDNEVSILRANGWLTVQVKVDEDTRLERIHRLYPEAGEKTLTHQSESGLTGAPIDIAIWNTTPDVRKTVQMLMETAANRAEQDLMRARLAKNV